MSYIDYTRRSGFPTEYCRVASEDRSRRRPTMIADFDAIIDHDNLIATYYAMVGKNGLAPGVDGLTPEMLGRQELAFDMRVLDRVLRRQTYWPRPPRPCPIPKRGGGTRMLQIPSLIDRVVARALDLGLRDQWESVFLPCSFGFRPGRSHLHLLAYLDALVTLDGFTALRTEDLLGAFDHVRLDHVLEDHRRLLHDARLNWLCETVVLGSGPKGRKVGIGQGCPYSPATLNGRLHHALDLRLRAGLDGVVELRFADNIVLVGRCIEALGAAGTLAGQYLAETGLSFNAKGHCLVDLRAGESAEVLGLHLRIVAERLCYRVGEGAFEELEEALLQAHETENPPLRALEVLRGWINAYGPAWSSERTPVKSRARLLAMARRLGFLGVVTQGDLEEWMASARRSWLELRQGVFGGWATLRGGLGLADAAASAR
jgi:hypothetical protein